jgi:hypothetical protein
MDGDESASSSAATRRAMVRAAEALDVARQRAMTPPDGLISRSGGHVSVFCAQCQRWIDCYDGIAPEAAHERHRDLLH